MFFFLNVAIRITADLTVFVNNVMIRKGGFVGRLSSVQFSSVA